VPSLKPPRGILATVALLAPALVVFGGAYRRLWGYLIDDVFISVRYARNLVDGHGLVYNVGERVEGYTNFLWTLLVAPGVRLGIVPWIKGMNALWAIAAALLAVLLTRRLAAESRADAADPSSPAPAPWWTALPGALCLASSPFILTAAEGLETMMFSALLMLAVLWTLTGRDAERLPRAGFAIVALGMTRPDGWAYLPWALWAGRASGRSWGWIGRLALVAGLGLAAHEIFRIAYYGDLLPNTLRAKGGGSGFLLERGWTQWVSFFRATGGGLWAAALLPLAWRRTRAAGLILIGAIAIRVAFHLWSGGPWMGRGRFLTPVLPLLLVLVTWGVALLARGGPKLVLALAAAAMLALLPGWRAHRAAESAGRDYGAGLRDAHQRLGADIAAFTDRGAIMAMDDAGLGPLVAGRTNIDMLGLNDRHLGRLPGAYAAKSDPGYVLGRRPDVVVLVASRRPPIAPQDLLVASQVPLFTHPRFTAEYAFGRSYAFADNYHLLLYVRRESKAVRDELRGPPVE